MGSFSESKTEQKGNTSQEANQTARTEPWGPQSSYLKDIFGQAQNLYDQQSGQSYNGEQVAQFNPQQLDMFQNMINYANTSPIAGALANQGNNLSNLGAGGVAGGMQGLQDFRPTGSTMGTIADAGLYADNPFISSQVDAAMRDATRNTYEGQLPANARSAALTGNANSSKRQIGDAIAQRGLADRTADVSAQLRGDAYSKGLDLSQNQTQFNDNAAIQRAQLLGQTGLSASELGGQQQASSLDAMKNLFGLGNEGGAGLQASDQASIDNALQKYTFNQADPWGSLMNYFNIIGAQNWGGTTKTKGTTTGTSSATGTQQASPAATIGGILTGIGGLIPGK